MYAVQISRPTLLFLLSSRSARANIISRLFYSLASVANSMIEQKSKDGKHIFFTPHHLEIHGVTQKAVTAMNKTSQKK
jgi:hypothetical protein